MTRTGLEAFDTTVNKTNEWLRDIGKELGWEDRHRSYLALRAVLHALRDRLMIEEAADFASQLPLLIRGIYYESWHPASTPEKFGREEFLSRVSAYFPGESGIDAESVVRAVFTVISSRVTSGEIADIRASLPQELRDLMGS